MSKEILVIADHFKGKISDITFEMLGKAREIADAAGGRVTALLIGSGVAGLAAKMGAADAVLCMEDERLAGFNPEVCQKAAAEIVARKAPWLVMVGSTSSGWDLAASLSAALDLPIVAYCKDLVLDGDKIVATSQLYGGKMLTEVEIAGPQAVVAVLPGAFRAEKGMVEKSAPVEAVKPGFNIDEARTRFLRFVEPQAGDVDITQAPVLVSVGRGIQNQDNVALAEELAQALGGALAASRPVVDQGWLPMTRQVGRSGMIVKPKLYLALGVSGAPEHVEGMRDSALIIAVNSDAAAPIFNVAHYGVVADLLEITPALTARVKAGK